MSNTATVSHLLTENKNYDVYEHTFHHFIFLTACDILIRNVNLDQPHLILFNNLSFQYVYEEKNQRVQLRVPTTTMCKTS